MINEFIRENKILATFILFLFMFCTIMITKPSFVFNKDGTVKDFGLGYNNKTVLPIFVFCSAINLLFLEVLTIILPPDKPLPT